MKTPKPMLFLLLLLLQLAGSAQVRWYQNQDASNPVPYGTVATAVQPFTPNSFIASYLWSTNGDENTWKISKSSTNGTEQRHFFITAISALVEFKVGKNNSVYVFEKSFTPDYLPQYRVYQLDANLTVITQRTIELPNDFFIYNVNAFELDASTNVYLVGDGQYLDGTGSYGSASFIWKMNSSLGTAWRKVDSVQTSYSRVHVDHQGNVLVLVDYYTISPGIQLRKYTPAGVLINTFQLDVDPRRYSLGSQLDPNDNLLLFGGQMMDANMQAMYLYKFAAKTARLEFYRTYFVASSTQLNDFTIDEGGKIFSLVSQFNWPDNQVSNISRINITDGTIAWTRALDFATDSCNLVKLVSNSGDRIFALGERRSYNYYSKGYSIRFRKNGGQTDGEYPAPDSVQYQRSHWLVDGIIDNNAELIAIGNTTDLDTLTYTNTYFHSFAAKFGRMRGSDQARGGEPVMPGMVGETRPGEAVTAGTMLVIYPNPVQDQLTVSGIHTDEMNRMAIYDMRGNRLLEQAVTTGSARIMINSLANGVYLLVIRSTTTGKEQSIKFVVKK